MSKVAQHGMPKTGEVIAGKYRIESLIGEGGMGAVFSATHVYTGRRMAVKWLLPNAASSGDAVQRLLREAQATGRIEHPNVVEVYDVGEHDGSPFLVMELLQGETLTAALQRGALKVQEIVAVLIAAIDGVAAAHRHQIIHRDIKPDNIFLCRDARGALTGTKVLDFGISKMSGPGAALNPRLTKTGAVMGTPYYMSPEQVRGLSDIDGRVDVYAFGVILYEALTGRVPFDGKTYSALVLEIATATPARPSQVNPGLAFELERTILKAMAREPADRFADLESLSRALAPFVSAIGAASSGTAARNTTPTSQPVTTPLVSESPAVPGRRDPKLLWVGAGALALIALGLGAWLLRDAGDDASGAHVVVPDAVAIDPAATAAGQPPPSVASPAAVGPAAAGLPQDAGSPPLAEAEPPETGTAEAPAAATDPANAATAVSPALRPVRERRRPDESEPPPKPAARSGTISTDDF